MIWNTPYISDPHQEPFTNYYDIFQQERYGNILPKTEACDAEQEFKMSNSEIAWVEQQLADPFTESTE